MMRRSNWRTSTEQQPKASLSINLQERITRENHGSLTKLLVRYPENDEGRPPDSCVKHKQTKTRQQETEVTMYLA